MGRVLIVPYGIEMELLDQFPVVISVLIVPYGIEITSYQTLPDIHIRINCTLWN